jgi:hypothetical protein
LQGIRPVPVIEDSKGASSVRPADLLAGLANGAVDGWGDLSKLHEVSSAETMRRLAKEGRAAAHEAW